MEKLGTKHLLQMMHGSGDRGLRDMALPCSPRQVERVGYGHKVVQLRQGKRQGGICVRLFEKAWGSLRPILPPQ